MSEQQARDEAVRRWGATGFVRRLPDEEALDGLCCHVCCEIDGTFHHGWGQTWEEAFAIWDALHGGRR